MASSEVIFDAAIASPISRAELPSKIFVASDIGIQSGNALYCINDGTISGDVVSGDHRRGRGENVGTMSHHVNIIGVKYLLNHCLTV